MTSKLDVCPTCGADTQVIESKDGSKFYMPVVDEKLKALSDKRRDLLDKISILLQEYYHDGNSD